MVYMTIYINIYKACPKKVTQFSFEITPEIFGLGNQLKYFWNAATYSYLAN